ncbi:MAG: hypothetical protein H6780_00805 [Candidatus Nomurabacteria bacterium]|nr:MAG: hypothetical protein H6780_00805 [Candidatus Nomurabacteria bacterium]
MTVAIKNIIEYVKAAVVAGCAVIVFAPMLAEAGTFTISGTIYDDEGATAASFAESLFLAIGTSTVSVQATSSDNSGNFSFTVDNSNGVGVDTPFVIWIWNSGFDEGTVVSKFASSTENLTGVDIYNNRIIVRQEGATSTTLADLDTYDASQHADIGYTASTTGDTLTVEDGKELYIWSSSTFVNAASSTFSGSFHNDGGVFDNNGGLAKFTGTSKTLSGTLTGSSALGDISIEGSYTASNNASTSNLTISGSLVAPSLLTIGGDFSQNGTFDNNGGTTYFTGPDPLVMGDLVGANALGDVVVAPSSGGGAWTARSAAGDNDDWYDVTYGNGLFVAVGWASNGADDVVMTSPDGITWTVRSAAGDNDSWQSVTYGNGLFVAVGSSGDRVMTSPDGVNWTVRSAAGNNDSWLSVTYGNGLFVAVGYSGDRVMTSPDGVNWTVRSTTGSWNSVAYGNGLFVAVGAGADRVITSPDGITWTVREGLGSWESVVYGDSYFVAVGWSDDNVMRSVTPSLTIYDALSLDSLTNASTSYATVISTSTVTVSDSLTNDGYLNLTDATLSVGGDYTNNGILAASTSEVIFSGVTQQTATGTLSGDSAFYDLTISNTSQDGTTTQSVIFGMPVETTGTFTMTASTSAQFVAGATSTFESVDWQGGASSPVWLRSSEQGTQWYLDIPGSQLNVRYVNVEDSGASSTVAALDSVDYGNNVNWTFSTSSLVVGSTTITNHDDTQVNNAFNFQNKTDEALFAFKLIPESGSATVTDLTITVSGAKKIDASDFSNIRLFRDHNNDALYDGGDEQVGGTGVFTLDDKTGTIVFTTDFLSTTTTNYLVIADWNAPENGAAMMLALYADDLAVADEVGVQDVYGTVDSVQHNRNNQSGGGGSSAAVGDSAPEGRSVETGGTEEAGEQIGDDPNYKWPTAHAGDFTTGANAYDQTDGTYATTNTTNASSSYSAYGYALGGSSVVTGIEVKLEVSGTTAAGDIGVQLSWDGGTTWTSAKTTPTLTTADKVITLGGASDTWGHGWSAGQLSNANFAVRIVGNPSSNTVQVDAIQVRVYHYVGGGGAGGGGAI